MILKLTYFYHKFYIFESVNPNFVCYMLLKFYDSELFSETE